MPTNCLSVFDNFLKLPIKGLKLQKNIIKTLKNRANYIPSISIVNLFQTRLGK